VNVYSVWNNKLLHNPKQYFNIMKDDAMDGACSMHRGDGNLLIPKYILFLPFFNYLIICMPLSVISS
jgi:hypothetical protein